MNAIQPPAAPSFAAQTAIVEALSDPAARRRIRANPRQYAVETGMLAADSEAAVKVAVNRPGVLYVAIARDNNFDPRALSADDLESLQAAGTASTGGSASSASSAGTLTSTVSTASSTACAGCAGSVSG